ncbi:hypothetical protein K501DRAFT_305976 [Backusella circina FSU 941]|nr:hypothetical protein K501DRAFT_305976 [Backusella circina FSU 941]
MSFVSCLKQCFKHVFRIEDYEYQLQCKAPRSKSVRFSKKSKNLVFYTYNRFDYDRRPIKKDKFRTFTPFKTRSWEATFSDFNLVEILNSEFDRQVIENTKTNKRRTPHGIAALVNSRTRI